MLMRDLLAVANFLVLTFARSSELRKKVSATSNKQLNMVQKKAHQNSLGMVVRINHIHIHLTCLKAGSLIGLLIDVDK